MNRAARIEKILCVALVPGLSDTTEAGLTLIDTVVVLFLTGLFMALSIPYGIHLVSHQYLIHTQEVLAYDLRLSQQSAQTLGSYARVRLSMYSPEYKVYNGSVMIMSRHFDPGVNYRDGYLQLTTGQIIFDQVGNAQVGGVIRLVNDHEESHINLYLGSGLVTVPTNLS